MEAAIKKKIESIGVPLKDWDVNIYRGLLTGYNEAFIIDEKTKNELIAKSGSTDLNDIIRPILRGRDIKKYKAQFANQWIINTHNGIKEKNIATPVNAERDYPTIYLNILKIIKMI